jgi:ParB family chromosome partitioning protein
MQLIENCLREDLRPVEQAKAFRALMDRNQWPALRLAEVLHLNVATVTRALALLELPGAVQGRVEAGELAPSVAYEISKVKDPDEQAELAARVVDENLSRSETIEAVRKVAGRAKGRGASKGKAKGKAARLPAEIKHRGSNGCRVVVHTASRHTLADVAADLRELLNRIEAEQAVEGGQQAA